MEEKKTAVAVGVAVAVAVAVGEGEAIRPSHLTPDQEHAFNQFLMGKSMCITGPAGCGKSFLITHIVKYCEMSENMECAVTATTGVAASLIHGQTIHRWAGIGTGDKDAKHLVENILKFNGEARMRWSDTRILIIDEVSMMSIELFNKLNYVAQQLRRSLAFFGGIQVIFCGDFAQLGPINSSGMCFEASDWIDHVAPQTVYLKTILRQCDPVFLQILEEVRLGRVTEKTRSILNARKIKESEEELATRFEGTTEKVYPTILYPHKVDVEKINGKRLDELIRNGASRKQFVSIDQSKCMGQMATASNKELDILNKQCMAVDKLTLCVGAQVMLIYNLNVEEGLVNGSLGVILTLEPDIKVIFDNGCETVIERQNFEIDLSHNKIIRQQIPLILAWAMTIHKCQGATLSNVITDLSRVFCEAQVYVTLSRVRSLEGLHLQGINYGGIRCNTNVRAYYAALADAEK